MCGTLNGSRSEKARRKGRKSERERQLAIRGPILSRKRGPIRCRIRERVPVLCREPLARQRPIHFRCPARQQLAVHCLRLRHRPRQLGSIHCCLPSCCSHSLGHARHARDCHARRSCRGQRPSMQCSRLRSRSRCRASAIAIARKRKSEKTKTSARIRFCGSDTARIAPVNEPSPQRG